MSRNTGSRCALPLMAFLVIGASSAWAEEDRNAARIEGTWFCSINWAPVVGFIPSEMLLNAGPGGTVTTTDTDDLTGFNPALAATGASVQGPGLGGWKRTRGHVFHLNYLPLGFAGTGPQAGLFVFLARFRCAVEVHDDLMNGACSVDVWWAVDPDGDGFPNSPNPVTAPPDLAIPDMTQISCNRIPVLPK